MTRVRLPPPPPALTLDLFRSLIPRTEPPPTRLASHTIVKISSSPSKFPTDPPTRPQGHANTPARRDVPGFVAAADSRPRAGARRAARVFMLARKVSLDFHPKRRTIRALVRPAPTRQSHDSLRRSRRQRRCICLPGKSGGSLPRPGTSCEAELNPRSRRGPCFIAFHQRGAHSIAFGRRAAHFIVLSRRCASSVSAEGGGAGAIRRPPANRGRGPARRRAGPVSFRRAGSACRAAGAHRRLACARAGLVRVRLRPRGRFRARAFRTLRPLAARSRGAASGALDVRRPRRCADGR